MYLKSLHLENIACFEELDLDFTDENGEPCKWVVLLGENGTGKSTIIRMLALTALPLMRFEEIESSFLGLMIFDLIRNEKLNPCYKREQDHNRKDHKIWSSGVTDQNFEKDFDGSFISDIDLVHDDKNLGYTLDYHKKGLIKGGKAGGFAKTMHGVLLWNPFLYGYSKSLPPERWIVNSDNRKSVKKIGRLFGLNESLSPGNWIKSLYLRTIHPEKTYQDDKIFALAINLVEKILPGIRYKDVTIDGDVRVFDRDNIVNIDDLSEGYRIISDFSFDLLRWIFETYPDSQNPLEESGVVLFDEIDLHLHPRWQRTIVQKIRETFPNLQFIVTSHSPFIAQDMTEKDKIIVLTRDGDKVTAREEKGFVQDWRAGQILTSWLFGLPTDYDEKIEEKLGKQQELVDRKTQGLLTDEEREELRQVTEFLSTLPSEETGTEILSQDTLDREAVRKAAATALRLLRKVEGK